MPSKSYPSPQVLWKLSDKELQAYETPARLPRSATAAFIPSLPVRVVQEIVAAKAEVILPLVLAIHRQIKMTKRNETPLNGAIWKTAGSPSQKKRETILRKLKTLPELVIVTESRTRTSHYSVSLGVIWGEVSSPKKTLAVSRARDGSQRLL